MIDTAPYAPVTTVDVIIALRNEEQHIGRLLTQVANQTHPVSGIFLVVAPSEDRTREVCVDAARSDPRVVVLDNPLVTAPHAINKALQRSEADGWIVLGGHSEIPIRLIETLCRVLNESAAACVGPLTVSVGQEGAQRAIALAMASPWGVGNARFRTGAGGAGPVDTVAFGLYRREITERVGLFNVVLTRNQDDEFNTRLRRVGGQILMTDEVRVFYYPRKSLRDLADQYRQYGHWRAVSTLVFGNELRYRQLAPPSLVLSLGICLAMAAKGRKAPLAALAATYAIVPAGQYRKAQSSGESASTALLSSAAVTVMQLSYGIGGLTGAFRAILDKRRLRRAAAVQT